MSRDQTVSLIQRFSNQGPYDTDGLIGMVRSWFFSPHLTPLPSDITLPANCYINIPEYLARYINEDWAGKRSASFLFIRLDTGDKARVVCDLVKKTYSIDRDTSDWVQVTKVPDFSKVQSMIKGFGA